MASIAQLDLFTVEQRQCIDCLEWKPLDDYQPRSDNPNHRQKFCKPCSCARVKEWRAKNANRTSYTCEECGTTGTTPNPVPPRTCQPCQRIAAAKAAGERHAETADMRTRQCARPDCYNAFVRTEGHRASPKHSAKWCSKTCYDIVIERAMQPGLLSKAIKDKDYPAILQEVQARVTVTSDGCWEWNGSMSKGKNGGRYPLHKVQGKNVQIHRIVLEAKHQQSLGTQVAHHMCANSECCNPDHLQPVTHRENIAEMNARQSLLARIRDLEAVVRDLAPDHPVLDVIELR